MKTNFSLDTAIVLAGLTAYLYTSGQVYLAAYLAVFHIDPVVLNIPPQDKIYWGFLNTWQHLAWLILVLIIYYLIKYLQLSEILASFRDKLARKRTRNSPPIHSFTANAEIESEGSSTFLNSVLIGLLLFFFLMSFAYTDINTSKRAQKALNNPTTLTKLSVQDNKSSYQQFLLKCGSSLCAIIDENKNVSLVEPKAMKILNTNFINQK